MGYSLEPTHGYADDALTADFKYEALWLPPVACQARRVSIC